LVIAPSGALAWIISSDDFSQTKEGLVKKSENPPGSKI
jgi:hypothetical protein